MKNNNILFFLSALLVISVIINSCKKETPQSSIQSVFTSGAWQLATVKRYDYVGSSQVHEDTLNTGCDTTQYFTFPTNSTCTYTNYHCIDQPKATGTWTLSKDGLNLYTNITCKDTLPGDSCCTVAHPFANAQIISIGLYQLTLQTGGSGYYTATTKRTIYRYGFVRVTNTAN